MQTSSHRTADTPLPSETENLPTVQVPTRWPPGTANRAQRRRCKAQRRLLARADRAFESGERVRHSAPVFVAKLRSGEAGLDDAHARPAVLLLERELDREVKARPLRADLGRGEHDAPGTVDDLEDAPMVVQVVRRGAERDRPEAAHAQVALRLHDPPRVVGPVEGDLAAVRGEGVEDDIGRRVDHALEAQLVGHWRSSTYAPNRSSRRSHTRR